MKLSRSTVSWGAAAASAAMFVVACAGSNLHISYVYHPDAGDNPSCGECHKDAYRHDHTEEWKDYNLGHRKLGPESRGDCVICHGEVNRCGGDCHKSD